MNYTVLRDNKDFVTLYKKGRYVAGREIVIYYRKNRYGQKRLGITTGKKIGNAVERVRCRRIIRAAFTQNESLFPNGYDYVIMARPDCVSAKSTTLSEFIVKSQNKLPVDNTLKK